MKQIYQCVISWSICCLVSVFLIYVYNKTKCLTEKFSHLLFVWGVLILFKPWNTLSLTHLFLTQDQDTSRFNWMPRSKILPSAKLLSILKSFPHSISGCPCYADMMPFSITDEERKLSNLQKQNNACDKPNLAIQAQYVQKNSIYSVPKSKSFIEARVNPHPTL